MRDFNLIIFAASALGTLFFVILFQNFVIQKQRVEINAQLQVIQRGCR